MFTIYFNIILRNTHLARGALLGCGPPLVRQNGVFECSSIIRAGRPLLRLLHDEPPLHAVLPVMLNDESVIQAVTVSLRRRVMATDLALPWSPTADPRHGRLRRWLPLAKDESVELGDCKRNQFRNWKLPVLPTSVN